MTSWCFAHIWMTICIWNYLACITPFCFMQSALGYFQTQRKGVWQSGTAPREKTREETANASTCTERQRCYSKQIQGRVATVRASIISFQYPALTCVCAGMHTYSPSLFYNPAPSITGSGFVRWSSWRRGAACWWIKTPPDWFICCQEDGRHLI